MRLKNFFSIPTGQKVTEKGLRRVLVSSICSILLCMTCLVSTTWAWFAVSIENTGNAITIATVTPIIDIKKDDTAIPPADGAYKLDPTGEYNIRISLDSQGRKSVDENMQKVPTVYVVMTVQESGGASQCYYFAFTDRAEPQTQIMIVNSSQATVSFSVSWVKPANADPAGGAPVVIGDVPATEPATEPTTEETTVPTTAPAETTEATSEPPETN